MYKCTGEVIFKASVNFKQKLSCQDALTIINVIV